MTWFKTDDGFWRHKKVRRLGDIKLVAVGLWQLAGSHSSDELSDGFVPFDVLYQWDPDGVATAKLIEVNLWELDSVDGEDGIRFHDWLDYNPSREKVLADREKERVKKERMRAALADKRRRNTRSTRPRGTTSGTAKGTHPGSPALPDPGSLPSSGTPAVSAAEVPPPASPETRASARQLAGLKPAKHRRHPKTWIPDGARPLMNTVRDPDPAASGRSRPSDAQRAEQDRLAELDAVQVADPGPGGVSPPPVADVDPVLDQQKRDTA